MDYGYRMLKKTVLSLANKKVGACSVFYGFSILTDSTIEQVESLDSMATDEVDKKPNIKKIEGLWITIFPP